MFLSCEDALDWAYLTSAHPIVKTAMINKMRQGSGSGRKNDLLVNLTVQDLHGQAALIIGLIDKLGDPAGREYIKARFGRRIMREDLRFLVYRSCDCLGVGLEKQEPVYGLLRAYFLNCLSTRTIRKNIGCRHYYAALLKSTLYEMLDLIHDRAMADIAEIFERQGLIRGRADLLVR